MPSPVSARSAAVLGAALAALALSARAATAQGTGTPTPPFVSAVSSTPTLIGVLTAGQTYVVTASGIASLCSSCNAGRPLSFTADGKPANDFSGGPYASMAPNGSDRDPTNNQFGTAGPGRLIGSLLGTYTLTPSTTDFFVIGLGTTLAPTTTVTLYGLVNDTGYGDNVATTGYSVTLAQQTPSSTVPEPSTYALMGAGLAALVVVGRRRRALAA